MLVKGDFEQKLKISSKVGKEESVKNCSVNIIIYYRLFCSLHKQLHYPG